MKKMNNLPNPAHYRTIIGAEKAPIPFRLIDEIRDTTMDIENETDYVRLYHNFVNSMRSIADSWENAANQTFRISHKAKEDARQRGYRWRDGQYALQNLDKTWATVIGSFEIEPTTIQVPIYDPGKCIKTGPNGLKHFILDCSPYSGTRTVHTTMRVPLKNDGFISPKYAKWTSSGTLNDAHNKYYPDTGKGGGYNDLELMRYKRTYTQGPNKKGQLEKPMKKTHTWINQIEEKN